MGKIAKQKRDFMELARGVVEQAIGEKMNGEPLVSEIDTRNPNAVALGRLGGKKGGAARAKNLTSAQKKGIAQKAARARWTGRSAAT
jgi:hypothetical protein